MKKKDVQDTTRGSDDIQVVELTPELLEGLEEERLAVSSRDVLLTEDEVDMAVDMDTLETTQGSGGENDATGSMSANDVAPEVVLHKDIPNDVRSFSMYRALEQPLLNFLSQGDGVDALPVFNESKFPESPLIDIQMSQLIKFLATGFGRTHVPEAFQIINRIRGDRDASRKVPVRFRSRHPLYTEGETYYQNVCLVSGMVHLKIPILPYFDGERVLEMGQDPEEYLKVLRKGNDSLF